MMIYRSNLIFLTMPYLFEKAKNLGFKVSFSTLLGFYIYKAHYFETFFETFMKLIETKRTPNDTSRFQRSFIYFCYKSINIIGAKICTFLMKPNETFESFNKNALHSTLNPQFTPICNNETRKTAYPPIFEVFTNSHFIYLGKTPKKLLPYQNTQKRTI